MANSNAVDLVYSEVRELLRRQEKDVDDIRRRAAAVVGVISLALSFFASAILKSGQETGCGFIVSMGLIVLGLVVALWVMLPRRNAWLFSPQPEVLLSDYASLSKEDAQEHLAIFMAGWIDSNQIIIDRLYRGLFWSILLAGVGVVMLAVVLVGRV
ncbi:MAG: hypothetical protein PVG83_04525 [Acidimicrobiia bacterium]|jgi:hypothetical protein